MADSKTTTTKTLAGGTLISTPVEKVSNSYYWYGDRTNSETSNQYGFAVIKSDGSVVAWGQNSYVPSDLDGTVDAVQIYSNSQNFAALRSDGSVVLVGYQKVISDTFKKLDGTIDVTAVSSTWDAFAALRADGSVVTWGEPASGGDSKVYLGDGTSKSVAKELDGTIDVKKIYSMGNSFAALRVDGSVVTWGANYSSSVASQFDGTVAVTEIYSNGYPWGNNGFTALRADGSLVAWGNQSYYFTSTVANQLDGTIDVTNVVSNDYASAALRADGSVITWGDSYYGGDSSTVSSQLDGTIDVTSIVSNNRTFAALRVDGSVVTWGDSNYGGDSSSVASQLDGTIDVTKIYSSGNDWNSGRFVALRADGSVVAWGSNQNNYSSGWNVIDFSSVANQLDGTIDVKSIFSNNIYGGASAALREDGSVVTWGDSYVGGDSSLVASQLDGTIDVTTVVSGNYGFAALRADGSVVAWGENQSSYFGSVANQLDGTIDVVEIHANAGGAFVALRADGSIVTWGQSYAGGDSSEVKSSLTSGVEVFANIETDDFYTAPDGMLPEKFVNHKPTGTVEITGIAKENSLLSAVNKIEDTDGLGSMNYQWLSDGAAIIGAVQPSYTLSQMDVGKSISVAVNYVDGLSKSESVTSSAVSVANVNDAPKGVVSISGTSAINETLTATNSLEDADGLGEISYQWLSSGKVIKGANQPTYTLSKTDLYKTISVKASYTDLQGTKESIASAESIKINEAINHAPTGTVLIAGKLEQGETVSIANTLADSDGLGTMSYQWFGDSLALKDATKETYSLTQADVYKTLSVKVSYTDGLGKVESVLGGVVLNKNDKPEGSVIINGVAKAGEVLTAQNTISDVDGLRGDFSYQWQADGEAFAEGDTLVLTKDEAGKAITVAAQYVDNGGTFESVVSNPTEKVLRLNETPTGYVIVMGEQKNGVELSVLSTLADVDGLGQFSYQWLSGDTPINNETNPTYQLTLGDVGERISVEVSYIDGYATKEVITSADTAAIQSSYVTGSIIDSKDSKVTGTEKSDVLSGSAKAVAYSITALVGNDVVSGNDSNDTLDGGKGDDKISGGKGSDKLIGGDGNDTLKGGTGADTMQGGDGNDYYFVDDAKDVVTESNKNARLGGNDTIETTISYTLDKNIENLILAGEQKINATGNEFANQITGNFGDNVLKGEAGNDDISGYKGADTLNGGDGEDVLDGGDGADLINGDAGDDFLTGGESSDTLNGGDGEDVAIFNSTQTDYEITSNTVDGNVQLTVKYIGNDINEGTDILTNIEMLKFGDDEVVSVVDLITLTGTALVATDVII